MGNNSGTVSFNLYRKADPTKAQTNQKYIFDKACDKCLGTKSKDYSIYCSHCLRVKCFQKECSPEGVCLLFQSFMTERVLNSKEILKNMIIDKRKDETKRQEKITAEKVIHSTHVKSTITITKRCAQDSQSPEEQPLDNCIKMCFKHVSDKGHGNARSKVIVRLDDFKYQIVGVFQKCGTDSEMAFIDELETYLKNEPVSVVKVDDCPGNLNDHDGPLIVVCLHQSRIKDDVKYTLEGIECKHFSRILLVLLHFKSKDSDYLAKDIEKCYTDLQVIDYFQQEHINNIEEVLKQAKAFIL